MRIRKYHLWEAGSKKTTREHIRKLDDRISKLESVIEQLTKELGYAITIEDFDSGWLEIKKVKK
tara:strand:+ start:14496 stop:14687 length:192 start_codon:yes stop_codon:yes gene_type:complete